MVRRFVAAWNQSQFELLWALACALTGLPLAFGVVTPQSIHAHLPTPVRIVWGLSLALGGSVVISGILIRYYSPKRLLLALQLERSGLMMLGTSILAYSIAIWLYAGLGSGAFGILIYMAFTLACLSRIRSINYDIAILKTNVQ